jgi:hypothetical protein
MSRDYLNQSHKTYDRNEADSYVVWMSLARIVRGRDSAMILTTLKIFKILTITWTMDMFRKKSRRFRLHQYRKYCFKTNIRGMDFLEIEN